MKLPFILIIVFILILALAWIFRPYAFLRASEVRTIFVGGNAFSVEVADTFATRAHGLSGHAPLGENEGMLFVFGGTTTGAFWMKDMLFPLDLVWIRDGIVVGTTENALPMRQTGFRLYPPPMAVDQVLEVNAHTVKRLHVIRGDEVH